MRIKSFAFSAMLLVMLQIAPSAAQAQCNVTNTVSFLSGSPATILIIKTLSGPANCKSTSQNAFECFPASVSFNGTTLLARAMSVTVAPSCKWSCTCGTPGSAPHVTIDGTDGLPVELMEFSVEE